jgi:pantothenate synthetase
MHSALEAELKEEEEARKASQQAAAAELSQELKAQTAALKASGASKAELLAAKDAALAARRKVEAKQVRCVGGKRRKLYRTIFSSIPMKLITLLPSLWCITCILPMVL